MKLLSWNVNGLRAVMNKGFKEFFKEINADILALQETKLQEGQIEFNPEGYYTYWNSAVKKGYSGTVVFTKKEPKKVTYGIGIEKHDQEGRVITLEFEKFYLINCYTPNSKRELERLESRIRFEDLMREYLNKLKEQKNVIYCGDLNVAHEEIDIKNPNTNHHSAGFTDEERNKMTELLNSGYIDTFRYFNKDTIKYTWWSYMHQARLKDIGWRIDYFIVNKEFIDRVTKSTIYTDVLGSDHCPIGIELKEV